MILDLEPVQVAGLYLIAIGYCFVSAAAFRVAEKAYLGVEIGRVSKLVSAILFALLWPFFFRDLLEVVTRSFKRR